MGIKHVVQTEKPNNPNYDVSRDAWNLDHIIDGDILPKDDDAFDLGAMDKVFRELFLGNTGIYWRTPFSFWKMSPSGEGLGFAYNNILKFVMHEDGVFDCAGKLCVDEIDELTPNDKIQFDRDIVLIDDMMVKLSNDTAGAAADSSNRGKLRLVHGGAGQRDRLYICLKGDAGNYSWVEIANGGV